MTVAGVDWEALGTQCHLLATVPSILPEAHATAARWLDDIDAAASRFRADSEVSAIARAALKGRVTTRVSPVLGVALEAALWAAVVTDGLVDPTMGRALAAAGYDTDFSELRSRRALECTPPDIHNHGTWRDVTYNPDTASVSVPQGSLLDLGATAKALAADLIAEDLAATLPGGFLVNLGGDMAVSGQHPDDGWRVGITDTDTGRHAGDVGSLVITDQAVATSSTQRRRWAIGTTEHHHIIDPRTRRPAVTPWASVTCLAADALEANTASTAAILLADTAPTWLATHGIAARLVHRQGHVSYTDGWPTHDHGAAA